MSPLSRHLTLRRNLENCYKRYEVSIASIYDINIYPSIKLATIYKLARFFSKRITFATNNKIYPCMELIHFGMISNLIYFY